MRRSPNKRRRLPNGFGQISEIKGQNLRKPFRVMVTTGKNELGRPICKLLKPESYFETYNDAYKALLKYNENPYDPADSITMAQLFDLWYADYKQSGRSESTIRGVSYAWAYCNSIYDLDVRRVKPAQIHNCLERASVNRDGNIIPITPYLIRSCKSILNMLFDYAVEHGITDRNYAKDASLPDHVMKNLRENTKHHLNYTEDEMQILWENVNKYPIISVILIQCYSGWRPQELLSLKVEDTDIENWTFKGGMKTEAGKNRIVPIHTRIRPFVKQYYEKAIENDCKYLLCKPERSIRAAIVPISYKVYVESLKSLSSKIPISAEHKPHDGRVQFVTMAKLHDVSEYAIKLLVGHSIQDITERVYTRRSLDWLRTEIEKIR